MFKTETKNIVLLQAYITERSYDFICLTQSFLNFSIQSDNHRITIDDSWVCSDKSRPSKLFEKGGVRTYHKEHTSLNLRDDINTLDSWLVTEVRSQNVKSFLTSIYCFPSQNWDEFFFSPAKQKFSYSHPMKTL